MNLVVAITPGAMKGKSVSQTTDVIFLAMQMWMKQCGVRFYTVAPGQAAHIHIGPTDRPFNGAMGALRGSVLGTGQIIYQTNVAFPKYWDVMAMGHEIGHIVGWDHTANTDAYREFMMHPHGSILYYFEPREAKRAELQLGRPTAYHWPDSLWHVGEKIRASQKAYDLAHSQWQNATKIMNDLITTRNAETNVDRRRRLTDQIKAQADKRMAADKRRRAANDTVRIESQNWNRIKRLWETNVWSVGRASGLSASGTTPPDPATLENSAVDKPVRQEPCACFSQLAPQAIGATPVDLRLIFDELALMPTEPMPGLLPIQPGLSPIEFTESQR